MKNKLAARLCLFFGLLRGLTVIIAIFVSLWVFVGLLRCLVDRHEPHPFPFMVPLANVAVQLPDNAVGVSAGDSKIHLIRATSGMEVDIFAANSTLERLAAWVAIPEIASLLLYGYFFCAYLNELCGNASRGELFSERNLNHVGRLGQLMIAYSIFKLVLGVIEAVVAGQYLTQNGFFVGIQGLERVHFRWENIEIGLTMGENLGNLVLGSIVILVNAVFRRGLALQQESELTV